MSRSLTNVQPSKGAGFGRGWRALPASAWSCGRSVNVGS